MNALRTLSRRLPGPVHLKPPIRLFSSRISYRNALPIAKTQRLRTHNNAQNSWRRTLTHSNRPFSRGSSQKEGSSHPNPTPNLGSPEPHSLSARLRKLTREYGYTVIGVYFALSLADFPFCFLAVKLLGAERVAHAEHVVVGGAKDMIQRVFPDVFQHKAQSVADTGAADVTESAEEAEVEATIWTQLALAFVIHKSFIFIRVPLTAAVTPKVVKTLRSWGYDIGKRNPKTSKPR